MSGLRGDDGLSASARFYRARRIGSTFGRVYLGIKTQQFIERRLAPTDMKRRWRRFNRQSAESIYDAAIELQGLILKGCQFLGSRADVLPPEYVRVLSKLQDRVPARSFGIVRRLVEDELGQRLEDVFEEFSTQPIASASLAQVHEARLRDGRRVAVKVQYPEIAALVRSDLANLRTLFRAVGLLEREFDLMPLVEELGRTMPRELDFVEEARTSERIAGFFEGRPDVEVPAVHWEWTRRRVLVMDFVDGIKISDVEGLRRAGVDPEHVMRTVIEAYCEQILVHGLFHADPHPGNLLVRVGPDGRPRLVFLDFGLAKELPADFRNHVVGFAFALLAGDAGAMGRALVALGFETRSGDPAALEAIAREVIAVAGAMRRQSFLDPSLTRQAGREIPRLVRENPIVRIPSHLVLVGRVLGLLSGLGRTLDARLDMLQTIWPYAAGAAGRAPAAGPTSAPSA